RLGDLASEGGCGQAILLPRADVVEGAGADDWQPVLRMILKREQTLSGLAHAVGTGGAQRLCLADLVLLRSDQAVLGRGAGDKNAGTVLQREQRVEQVQGAEQVHGEGALGLLPRLGLRADAGEGENMPWPDRL